MRDLTAEQLQRVEVYAPHVKAGADTEADLAAATGIAVDIVAADLADADFCAALLAAVDAVPDSDGAGPHHDDAQPTDATGAVAVTPPAPLAPSAARAEPAELAAQARRVTAGLLDVVEAAVQAGDVDVDDAARLLPRVHAVHADHARLEAAQKDNKPKLPVFNFVIHMSGAVTAERCDPVIEAEPVQPTELDVSDAVPSSTASAALPAPGDPLDFLAAVAAGLEQQQRQGDDE